MRCFAGIDIGSTNIKCLSLNENGDIVYSKSLGTPILTLRGLKYFDIGKVDEIVDVFFKELKQIGTLVSVSFCSVGESVVPVKAGKSLENPLFWDEVIATSTTEERKIINHYAPFAVTGIKDNGLLSLDKILWCRRNASSNFEEADYFLPMASYQIYRKTGVVCWDYSLASRTNAYSPFTRQWQFPLLQKLGLEKLFGEIAPMGSICAEHDNIVYGLGGHDHITGLFGLYTILGEEQFIFDSMGTSSNITLVTTNLAAIQGNKTYSECGGGIVNGFIENQFIVMRGLRRYGSLISFWMKHFGLSSTDEAFKTINQEILKKIDDPLAFIMAVGGNFFESETLGNSQVNYYQLSLEATASQFVKSTYLYNALKTEQIIKNLIEFKGKGDLHHYCGGAAIKNNLFMEYKATTLGTQIHALDLHEICAFGAVCSGIIAAKANNVLETLRERFVQKKTFNPNPLLSDSITEGRKRYSTINF